jgi:hypothetical protein
MRMNTNTAIVIFALVAAFGLLGVIAVDSFTLPKIDAAGCTSSKAFNASKGRCFGH